MEKIAILSDIHGNLPALQAVLEDIHQRSVSKIICIGDIIGKGPNSVEAIDIIREKCEYVIAGNWDKFVAMEENEEKMPFAWYRQQIGQERLEYLRNLPEAMEFYCSGKLIRLVHAHPQDIFKRIYPFSPLEERLSMFIEPTISSFTSLKGKSNIVGYGDIHHSYLQNIEGRILFNVGSVGNPLDFPEASYVILEGNYLDQELGSYSIQFQRVPYDIDLAVRQAKEKGMPEADVYEVELKTAVYRGRQKKFDQDSIYNNYINGDK